ncbi:response regulator [Zhouia amylolytica AD3]|uniref:Response regulator n=2 Tax=Zhouia amylolytica TaxID=376730 RepID=W2UQV3_9FLAO|nr:response regulator [Zhouia amylolytica AD3]
MEMAEFCNNFLVFQNGEEALTNLKPIVLSGESVPDVILLDLNMPIMDGWEFLDNFIKLEAKRKILIYIVSSSIDPADIIKAKSYKGLNNFIVKPITREVLSEIMRDAVKH